MAPWAGAALLAGWTGLFGWLFLNRPMLADPRAILQALDAAEGIPGDVAVLAAMAPILVWTVFLIVVATILMVCGQLLAERRLLQVLDTTPASSGESPAASTGQ